MIINKNKIQQLWKEILIEIGENPNREGLLDTPKRISNMYEELFKGYDKTKLPKVTIFNNGCDGLSYDQMITDEGDFYSQCEHHGIPFFGKYYFAIQERLTNDIVEYIWNELCNNCKYEPLGMALIMKGEHLCKTMRGAKKKGLMTTSVMKGNFKKQSNTREEFLNLINGTKNN